MRNSESRSNRIFRDLEKKDTIRKRTDISPKGCTPSGGSHQVQTTEQNLDIAKRDITKI